MWCSTCGVVSQLLLLQRSTDVTHHMRFTLESPARGLSPSGLVASMLRSSLSFLSGLICHDPAACRFETRWSSKMGSGCLSMTEHFASVWWACHASSQAPCALWSICPASIKATNVAASVVYSRWTIGHAKESHILQHIPRPPSDSTCCQHPPCSISCSVGERMLIHTGAATFGTSTSGICFRCMLPTRSHSRICWGSA